MSAGHRHPRTDEVILRLSKVEGHVRGIKQMVEEGKSCSEVLLQISAVLAALRKTAQVVLEDHVDHCLLGAGPDEMRERLVELKDALSHFGR